MSNLKVTLDQHIQTTLAEAVKVLFPVGVDAEGLIKPHVWRDRKYVGECNGKVLVWRGWSANLVSVDFRYRAIFADVVDNLLPFQERVKLFGPEFAAATAKFSQFVVLFVLDFPLETLEVVKAQGFIPRTMTKALHACIVAGIDEFLGNTALHWAAKVSRLVLLQRFLSTHRKPYDANEVPLQNLLYKTGFLHSYLVKGGLQLYQLSSPRKAGEFGHDFHAVVNNPLIPGLQPFPLGIEIYTGAVGYHIDTIPQYITKFQLKGMIVISKDNPISTLNKIAGSLKIGITPTRTLAQFGTTELVGIHHLPLSSVIAELSNMREELESLIPSVNSLE